MSRLILLKPQEVIRKLKALGYEGPVRTGRHPIMLNLKERKTIPIPMHKGKDITVGLIKKILREVEISLDEWNNL
ncbi:MAG: type II toxin-antitoxin system HicA family toxin [Candidatus Tectomicrobia bacterium]|uniref:Type II toxin-antitoxin system HicA family toxin n=1 Tax=Tectimicrobiota bacterium TaxID=2528274 RepID=A0A933LPI0_UNCTE|nr:type II toxin-antitoxin system HicA family toxin [Candidatus Tectomicrobia bacterium]